MNTTDHNITTKQILEELQTIEYMGQEIISKSKSLCKKISEKLKEDEKKSFQKILKK